MKNTFENVPLNDDEEQHKLSLKVEDEWHAEFHESGGWDELTEIWSFRDELYRNFDIDYKSNDNNDVTTFIFYPSTPLFKENYGGGEALNYTELVNALMEQFGYAKEKAEQLLKDAFSPDY